MESVAEATFGKRYAKACENVLLKLGISEKKGKARKKAHEKTDIPPMAASDGPCPRADTACKDFIPNGFPYEEQASSSVRPPIGREYSTYKAHGKGEREHEKNDHSGKSKRSAF